ncbi:hypothetical protein AVEN_110729-1 [Araneus ventricosus]|uniref:CRAL-TRIO domain-containing protein n=1 Tax=Araneus ventricosus TaxID=182803 RepID=A0A4Y2SNG8_ARAVE|nr:hypothetical protein AVEN_110729-1 [Araneus ventricosus]
MAPSVFEKTKQKEEKQECSSVPNSAYCENFISAIYLRNCFPGRYKAVHIIHENLPMKVTWNLMKPLLSEKMRNRIHFHSNGEELLDVFPSSVIPTKYGGKLQETFDILGFLRNAANERDRYTIEGRPNIY